MKTKDIKTIEVVAKEWFDKTYGNSYFSANIYVNDKLVKTLPFQYGYGDHYEYVAFKWIKKHILSKQLSKKLRADNFYWLKDITKIAVFTVKHENCLKRELDK